MAFEWTVYATMSAILLSVVAILAVSLFHLLSRMDGMSDRIDQRFERMDQRFDRIDQRFERMDQRFDQVDQRFDQVDQRFGTLEMRMRDDKAELLGRMDVLAERISRLEAQGGSAA